MKNLIAAVFAVAAMLMAVPAQADTRVQVGVLTCTVDPGIGLIIVSRKNLKCSFARDGYKTEQYSGSITKLGIDIGVTGVTKIVWLVFSASSTKYARGSLAGNYVGGSAEASLGVGLGANWLIGGSKKGYALQPFSVQGQVGINYSVAITDLRLRAN